MTDFLKKQTIGSYVIVAAAVLAIVALILTGVSSGMAIYGIGAMPVIVTFTILGIALIAGAIFLATKFGDKAWMFLILLAAVVLFAFSFYFLFNAKTVSMGNVWWGDPMFKANIDPIEVSSLNVGLVAMVFYILAALMVGVGAFFRLAKKTEA